jgi:ClpP class serine protease
MYLANAETIQQFNSFDKSKLSTDLISQYNDYIAKCDEDFKAGIASDAAMKSRVLEVVGNTASINVSGPLTKDYTLMTWFMGGTAYSDISNAISLCEADSEIENIVINMNSGGGSVLGLFELTSHISATEKNIDCVISGACCSAAYAIASQCNAIHAKSDGEMIGSIGVVVDTYVSENEVSITSSNAPKKRQDLSTDEGKANLRAELDEYEELFLNCF